MSDDIRISACGDEDVPALMRFIDAHWQAGHILSRDEVLLRWQFDPGRMPGGFPEGPTVMLAWHHHTLVGMLGLTGFDLNAEGVPVRAAWMSHWLAVPEYRHLNVAARLLLAVRQLGLDALGAVGANDLSTQALLTLGYELIPDLPRWVGVFHAGQTASLLAASGTATRDVVERICLRHGVVDGARPHASVDGVDVVRWTPELGGAWDRHWRERLAGSLVGASRDSGYLRWRYADHPRFRYELRMARRPTDGSALGIAVFRVEQVRARPERVLRVVEFLASPEAEAALALAVVQAGRDARVAFADFYCSSARSAQALERLGFRSASPPSDVAFPCRLQPLEGGHFTMPALLQLPSQWQGRFADLIASSRLYVTKSDGDQDRPA
ncbi:MAG: hypothetical protein E6J20_01045 [Chloroflexi bacterium]|nr:MAG: hypothetical protein E6J20_01045 [Chloroflexota bacterium]